MNAGESRPASAQPPMATPGAAGPAAGADPPAAGGVDCRRLTTVEVPGEVAVSITGDRRGGPDRRARPTPMLSRYALFGGRRRTVRRAWESDGAFVDVHGARLFVMVMAIVALNLLDAWFTLLFLAHGGRELNPLVQGVLDLSEHPWPFLLFKTVGIGVACGFLALTKNFRAARIGLWFVFGGYALLLGWHLYLLSCLDSAG